MRKGQKTRPETKIKQSLAHKGKKKNYPVWNKGKKIGNRWPNAGQFKKGQRMSEEMRLKIKQAHIERFRELIPNYVPGKSHSTARNQRILQNGGYHTDGEWETLKAQYNWTCPHCGAHEPEIKLTKDHIIPLSRGGSNNIENIQPLCRICNTKKGIKIENRVNSGETQNGQS